MNGSLVQFILFGLLILTVGYIVFRILPRILDRFFDTVASPVPKTLAYFISDSLGIALLLIIAIYTLLRMDENAQLIAIVITVISGAFIFTSEGWAQDALAGISLQFYPQYAVGDWVTLADNRGRVTRVGLFRTHLETLDLDIITVRNSQVLQANIINHSGIHLREVEVIVHTAGYGDFGDDIHTYKAAVQSIAERVQNEICPSAMSKHQRSPAVYFMEFGSSSDFVTVVFYTFDQDESYRVAVDAMHTAMAAELRPQGVVLGQVNANTIDNVLQIQRVE